MRAGRKAISKAFQGTRNFPLSYVGLGVHLAHGLQGTYDVLLIFCRVWVRFVRSVESNTHTDVRNKAGEGQSTTFV